MPDFVGQRKPVPARLVFIDVLVDRNLIERAGRKPDNLEGCFKTWQRYDVDAKLKLDYLLNRHRELLRGVVLGQERFGMTAELVVAHMWNRWRRSHNAAP